MRDSTKMYSHTGRCLPGSWKLTRMISWSWPSWEEVVLMDISWLTIFQYWCLNKMFTLEGCLWTLEGAKKEWSAWAGNWNYQYFKHFPSSERQPKGCKCCTMHILSLVSEPSPPPPQRRTNPWCTLGLPLKSVAIKQLVHFQFFNKPDAAFPFSCIQRKGHPTVDPKSEWHQGVYDPGAVKLVHFESTKPILAK